MEYIDQLHRDQIAYLTWVRKMFQEAKDRATQWEPRLYKKEA